MRHGGEADLKGFFFVLVSTFSLFDRATKGANCNVARLIRCSLLFVFFTPVHLGVSPVNPSTTD